MKKMTRKEYETTCNYRKKGDCPFCEPEIQKHHILFESEHWIVFYARYPYFDEENSHIILAPKKHIEFTSEIPKYIFADMKYAEAFLREYFANRGEDYFSFIRQSRSNKSVEHLHYHYLGGVPSMRIINGEKYIKIKKGA